MRSGAFPPPCAADAAAQLQRRRSFAACGCSPCPDTLRKTPRLPRLRRRNMELALLYPWFTMSTLFVRLMRRPGAALHRGQAATTCTTAGAEGRSASAQRIEGVALHAQLTRTFGTVTCRWARVLDAAHSVGGVATIPDAAPRCGGAALLSCCRLAASLARLVLAPPAASALLRRCAACVAPTVHERGGSVWVRFRTSAGKRHEVPMSRVLLPRSLGAESRTPYSHPRRLPAALRAGRATAALRCVPCVRAYATVTGR